MRRASFFGAVFLIAVLVFTSSVMAQVPEINGKAAILIDARSGMVFYEKNSEQPLPMASVTKMMTLTLILEAVAAEKISLDDIVRVSPYAASIMGTHVWLEPGEQFPLRELVYAIAVGSANDASVAVAEYIAGSEQAFVEQMNKRAKELGLESTIFANSSGLPVADGSPHAMSAKDAAKLAQHVINVPLMMDFVSTYEYTMRKDGSQRPQLWNYNRLLRRYQGVDGIKTGFTSEAGYCIVATAQRDGLRLICVVFGSETEADRENDVRTLLDYGFRKYRNYTVLTQGEEIDTVILKKAVPEQVKIVLAEDLNVTIERGEEKQVETKYILKENIEFPLMPGESIGEISGYLNEQKLGSANLTVTSEIKRAGFFTLVFRMMRSIIQVVQ